MMDFFLGTTSKEVPGPELTIDCLWCGMQGTNAHSRKRIEWLTIFHLLPVFPFHTVFVRCNSCQKDMVAKCSLEELTQSNPLTLKHLLVKRVSLVGRTCIVLGLLFCWTPLCGLIPAVIGYFYGRNYGGRMRRIAFWGLLLNLLSPAIFVLLVIVVQALSK